MSMNVFDVTLHGKNISLRDFSAKAESRGESTGADAPYRGAGVFRMNPTVNGLLVAFAMTLIYAMQHPATDWSPLAGYVHFFLASYLPLHVYGRLTCSVKQFAVWPAVALHASVMLFAYPYDRAEISSRLFFALTLLNVIFTVRFSDAVLIGRHIIAVCVILNALLCLTVYMLHAAEIVWYYNLSFFALFALFVSY
jgi:hypothetical protein